MGPGRDISHESYRLTLFPLSTSPPTYSISDMGFDSLLRTVSSLHLVSASSVLIIVIFSNDAAITTSFHICSSIVSGSDDATSTSKCLPPTPLPIPAYHHYTSCLTVYHSGCLSACFFSRLRFGSFRLTWVLSFEAAVLDRSFRSAIHPIAYRPAVRFGQSQNSPCISRRYTSLLFIFPLALSSGQLSLPALLVSPAIDAV